MLITRTVVGAAKQAMKAVQDEAVKVMPPAPPPLEQEEQRKIEAETQTPIATAAAGAAATPSASQTQEQKEIKALKQQVAALCQANQRLSGEVKALRLNSARSFENSKAAMDKLGHSLNTTRKIVQNSLLGTNDMDLRVKRLEAILLSQMQRAVETYTAKKTANAASQLLQQQQQQQAQPSISVRRAASAPMEAAVAETARSKSTLKRRRDDAEDESAVDLTYD